MKSTLSRKQLRSKCYKQRRQARSRRQLFAEGLESRVLLAGDTMAWHNAELPLDTNQDRRITSLDALMVVNDLNINGTRDVNPHETPRGKLDVTADGVVSARDVLEIVNYLNSGAGEDDFQVEIRLEVVDSQTLDPITSIGPDEAFVLRGLVTDVRDVPEGVFGAYLDVTYNADLADAAGDIELSTDFPNGPSGDASTDGLIDEVGGFSNSLSGNGAKETLLFSIPMTTESKLGTIAFAGDGPDILPNHEITVFGDDDPIPNDEVRFLGTSLQIISNEPPTAVADAYNGTENTTLTVPAETGVLANDLPEGAALTARLVTNATNGTVTLASDGSFTYEPNEGFDGQDSFTYVASSGNFESPAATVVLDIAPVVEVLRPVDDAYTARANNQLLAEISLFDNDITLGRTVEVVEVVGPANGTVSPFFDGRFAYDPDEGFIGVDTFTYRISDGENTSEESATVTITVEEVLAEATDDEYAGTEDEVLEVDAENGVLINDVAATGESMSVALLEQPANGSVTLNEDGSFTYTPADDFNGDDTFTYELTSGEQTDAATVTISVAPVNDPPVAVDDSYEAEADRTLVVDAAEGVLANDSDVDGDSLTAEVDQEPANGTLLLAADGSFEYTPADGFIGVDSFVYSASDGTESRQATVTLDVQSSNALVEFRLAAVDAEGNVVERIDAGQSFNLQVFVDDVSPEPQLGVFAAYLDVTWDSFLASVNGPIEFSATYPNGKSGNASTPGLLDELGAFDGLVELGGEEQLLATIPMLASGDGTLTFASDPADVLPFGDVLLFDSQDDAVPTEQIVYGTTSLTVEGSTTPVAVDDEYETDDGTVSVDAEDGVLANDLSPGGGSLSSLLVDGPMHGTVELNGDGSFTYTAEANFVGTDTFTYRATTVAESSNVATVTISVGDPSPSSLSGYVYFDTNNDGVRGEEERAFGGVNITLTGTDVFGNPVQRSTVTSSSGFYSFGQLSAGSYDVTEEQPAHVIDGLDTAPEPVVAGNDLLELELAPGTDLTELNFGERGLHPAYFGNPLFFASRVTDGARIAVTAADDTSWFCMDAGWSTYRSLTADVSSDGSFVTVTAIAQDGDVFVAGLSASNPNVRIIGSAARGYLVRLLGSSSNFDFQQVASAEAVDVVFAE